MIQSEVIPRHIDSRLEDDEKVRTRKLMYKLE